MVAAACRPPTCLAPAGWTRGRRDPPAPAAAASAAALGGARPPLPDPRRKKGSPEPPRGRCVPRAHLRPQVGTPTRSPVPDLASTHSVPKCHDPSAHPARPRSHPVPATGPAYRSGEAAAAARSPGPRGSGRPGRARRRERSRLLPAAPAPAPGAWFLLRARGLPERDFCAKKKKRPNALK